MEVCRRHQLNNGLEVLLIPTHHAPVVTTQAWIRFGAADESNEIAGLAHLFEHLLFKGTSKRGVGEIAKEIEGFGGDVNAFTTYDHTVMHMTMGKEHLANGVDILADCLCNSLVDPTELEREKIVVIEEIKRRNDKPSSKSADKLREMLFGKHPYSRPVIGFEEVVANLSRDVIFENYKKFYNSKNIFLVIAGDFDEKSALNVIEDKFQTLESGPTPGTRNSLTRLESFKPVFQKSTATNIIGHMCWRGVSASSEDSAALDALAFIFGQSESSRLVKKLIHEERIFRDIGAWSWAPKETGSIEIDFRAPENSREKIGQAFELIRDSIDTPITHEELERAKKNILAGAISSKESVDGLANRFGYYESITGDWANDLRFHDKVKTLNLEEVEAAKRKYMNWDDVVVSGIYPEKSKAPKTKVRKKKISAEKDLKVKEGKVVSFTHNGLKVLVKPQFHIPLFSMRWTGLGGTRMETEAKSGLGSLWARTIDTGCISRDGKNLSRETINKVFDDMSAEMHAFFGRNSFGFYIDGMSEDFERLVDIFSDLYKSPTFDEKEIQLEKKQQINQIKSMTDNPTAVLSKHFHEAMFKKHSLARGTRGTVSSVRALQTKDVKNLHNRLWKQPQVVSVVGNVTPSQVKAALSRAFENVRFAKTSALQKQKPFSFPKVDSSQRKTLKKEQSHIMLGFPTHGLRSVNRHALTGMSAVLSGQGGRLFLELRDKMSLCYSVGPSQMQGIDGGYFSFYIGTSPEKEEIAIEAIRKQIARLTAEEIPTEEWERAKRYYIGNHVIEQQHFSGQAFGMALDELYGLGYNEYFKLADHLNQLTPSRIRKAARAVFSRPETLVIVGPKKK